MFDEDYMIGGEINLEYIWEKRERHLWSLAISQSDGSDTFLSAAQIYLYFELISTPIGFTYWFSYADEYRGSLDE